MVQSLSQPSGGSDTLQGKAILKPTTRKLPVLLKVSPLGRKAVAKHKPAGALAESLRRQADTSEGEQDCFPHSKLGAASVTGGMGHHWKT